MSRLIPDLTDHDRLATLLIMGDILTKRGELGPLARVWGAVGPRRGHAGPRRIAPAPERSGRPDNGDG